MKFRPIIATAGIVAGLTIAACGPPPAVDALLQRGACDPAAVAPAANRCVHYVNHKAAWGYPPETEWEGT